MYYDKLKGRVMAAVSHRKAIEENKTPVTDCMAECYLSLHDDIKQNQHSIYNLPGGRGSCKSSFVSLEIVNGIMENPGSNAIVFRKTANTMRESVFAQIAWAIDALGVTNLWKGNVSPMQFIYISTGQQIIFRGLDDASKLKSIKPRTGYFKYVWFEEFSELNGPNMVRSVLQSVVRGGVDFKIFNSFNPPISKNNWANKYILVPDNRAITFKTDYQMIPAEWLGESFIEEAERLKQINPQAYKHEYLGEAVGSGGEVFPQLRAQTITTDDIYNMDYFYCGLDWGFSVDPFAFVCCSYNRKKDEIYILDEIYKKHCSNYQIAQMLKEKGYQYSGRGIPTWDSMLPEKQTIYADSAEPKSINDLKAAKLKVLPCTKYPGSVIYGIKWLQHRQIIIDPQRTPNAWREFSSYEYQQTKDGEFLADVPDKDNHLIDATRYAFDKLINNRKVPA